MLVDLSRQVLVTLGSDYRAIVEAAITRCTRSNANVTEYPNAGF